MTRVDGRAFDQMRPIKITYDVFEFAAASLLYEIGKTKVLCAVTLQVGVPPFLRGKKTGWLNAEYAMLPAATPSRNQREIIGGKRSGRSVEISRMIGRSFRSIMDLDVLGERTIVIDCDVQQADGGTRTACITAAQLALGLAQERWLLEDLIEKPFLHDELAAISVGILDDKPILDVSFSEDSEGDADFNFVLTRSGKVIEIQGSAEKKPIDWHVFEQVRLLAMQGITGIFNTVFKKKSVSQESSIASSTQKGFPLFTQLQGREVGELG